MRASTDASAVLYIQARNPFVISASLYIHSRNPFVINETAVYAEGGYPTHLTRAAPTNPGLYIQAHNPFAISQYLYIQNRKPFVINKTGVYAEGGYSAHLTHAAPANLHLYIRARNPFIISQYLYIQNRNPFVINESLVYTKGVPVTPARPKVGGPETRRGVSGPRPMQAARKPDSVLDDHSSRRRVTAPLQQPTRKFRLVLSPRAMLFTLAHRADTLVPAEESGRDPCLFGLAPCGVYHAASITERPVRSYRTFSPLPAVARRRYVFCCTGRLCAFGRTSRTLSGTLPCGVRTFLPLRTACATGAAIIQPPAWLVYRGTGWRRSCYAIMRSAGAGGSSNSLCRREQTMATSSNEPWKLKMRKSGLSGWRARLTTKAGCALRNWRLRIVNALRPNRPAVPVQASTSNGLRQRLLRNAAQASASVAAAAASETQGMARKARKAPAVTSAVRRTNASRQAVADQGEEQREPER